MSAEHHGQGKTTKREHSAPILAQAPAHVTKARLGYARQAAD
jgi:hypothetical protein